MTRYAGGANAERELKAALELAYPGCLVIRSAGSHSPVDLVMIDTCTTVFQVKSTSGMSTRLVAEANRELNTIPLGVSALKYCAFRQRGEWTICHGTQAMDGITNEVRRAVTQLRAKRKKVA